MIYKTKILIATLIISFLVIPICNAKTYIYFSPSKKCESNIVKFINQSTNTIDIAVYAINNDNIVEALKKAYDRNVKLRILTDKQQASLKHSKVIELYKYGINIKVHSKFKIEHNKFAIFNSKIVTSGSYNWTNSATDKNSENCILMSSRSAILSYIERFQYLWDVNSKEKSEIWFKQKFL